MVSERAKCFDKIITSKQEETKADMDSNGVALKPNYYIIDLLKARL